MAGLTFTDVYDYLVADYQENNNEDENFDPDAFVEFLDGLSEEEIIDRYNELTDSTLTVEDTLRSAQGFYG